MVDRWYRIWWIVCYALPWKPSEHWQQNYHHITSMLITVYVNVPENFPLFKSCNRNQIHIFLHSWLLCFENTVGFIWLKRLYLCLLAYTLEIIAMMVFTFQCTYILILVTSIHVLVNLFSPWTDSLVPVTSRWLGTRSDSWVLWIIFLYQLKNNVLSAWNSFLHTFYLPIYVPVYTILWLWKIWFSSVL